MRILWTLRSERPDVLHCTVDSVSPLFVLAAKLCGVPVVGSIHTDIQVGILRRNLGKLSLLRISLRKDS